MAFRGSEAGFSLAEVMVASAVLGVITLAMMRMVDTQLKTINYLEDRISSTELATTLSRQMLVPDVCDSTLKGISIKTPPANIEVKGPDKKIYFSAVNENAKRFDHLEIKKIQITNEDVPDHAGSGWVNLEVRTRRLRKGTGPVILRPATARVRVLVNDGMTILSCDTGRITALDCGSHSHGKIVTTYTGSCPNRIRKRDMCVAGIWLLYEKRVDPEC